MKKKSNMDVHFSSKTNEWDTPQAFYDILDRMFNFTLDPCATEQSKKCEKYFTVQDDGLSKSWANETVFMNPPYGRQISKWIKKAYDESINNSATVVCLIPSRTDTRYWHDYVMKSSELYFIKGRLKFGNSQSKPNSAPFPSAVVVFKPRHGEVIGGGNPTVYGMTNGGVKCQS